MKELIGQMQLTMRSKYTEEEIDRIRTIAEELGRDPELFVLPVENVISRKANLKFDTPPVIKGNRMLIRSEPLWRASGQKLPGTRIPKP